MKVIGLTGGIGSGKSTVAGFLAELGAKVLDLDKTGHEVLKRNEIRDRLVTEFGRDILSTEGEIDRCKLGKKVFGDKEALATLNAIVHPAIDEVVKEKIGEYRRQGLKVVILEAAALLEAKRDWQADEVWVTMAPESTVRRRLSGRPGFSDADVKARIGSQITNEERHAQADVVIVNDGTLGQLRSKVESEWERLQERI